MFDLHILFVIILNNQGFVGSIFGSSLKVVNTDNAFLFQRIGGL